VSYADVITTPTVLDPVIRTLPLNTTAAELGAQITAAELKAQITANVPANTVSIRCSPWKPSTYWCWDWS
jgi:capsular polysaccharide biosynthesis protein